MMGMGVELAERGVLPDLLVRAGIRSLLRARLRELGGDDPEIRANALRDFLAEARKSPIAVDTTRASRLIASDSRAPNRIRASTSRPESSVPSTCAPPGARRVCPRSTASGSQRVSAGAKIAAKRSALRWMAGRSACARSSSAARRASVPRLAGARTRTAISVIRLRAPAGMRMSGVRATGVASPLTADSSSSVAGPISAASTGHSSPGGMTTSSPTASSPTGTRSRRSPRRRKASRGARLRRRSTAPAARALAPRPSLILADEPTGNLDLATGAEVMDLLFGLKERTGATLLLITHDRSLAKRCGRIVSLADGRIVGASAKRKVAAP